MIGNDIIDLKIAIPEKKSAKPRLLQKIFSTSEIEQIMQARDSDIILWKFWSMKESVYKALQREFNLPRKFNPKSFECSLDESLSYGKVVAKEEVYPLKTTITKDYIYCTTLSENFMYQKIFQCDLYSEKILLKNIASDLGLDDSTLSITKTLNGVPFLHLQSLKKKIPISLSHHGKFAAYIIPLIKS